MIHETCLEAVMDTLGHIPPCHRCDGELGETPYFVEGGEDACYICEECGESYIDVSSGELEEWISRCKFTCPLPKFDEAEAWSISREQYESGDRVSNTENAYRTRCRHEFTNYDVLCAEIEKGDCRDEKFWQALRDHVDEMIDDETKSRDLIIDSRYEFDDEDSSTDEG